MPESRNNGTSFRLGEETEQQLAELTAFYRREAQGARVPQAEVVRLAIRLLWLEKCAKKKPGVGV